MAIYRAETACRACGGADLVEILASGQSARRPAADRGPAGARRRGGAADPDVLPGVQPGADRRDGRARGPVRRRLSVFFLGLGTLLGHSRANAEELIERRQLGRARSWSRSRATTATCSRTSSRAASRCSASTRGGAGRGRDRGRGADAQGVLRRDRAATRAEGRAADVIIANNVLAHVADLNGLVEGSPACCGGRTASPCWRCPTWST